MEWERARADRMRVDPNYAEARRRAHREVQSRSRDRMEGQVAPDVDSDVRRDVQQFNAETEDGQRDLWTRIRFVHEVVDNITINACDVCNKAWPQMEVRNGVCGRCKRDNRHRTGIRKFSAQNDMDPGVAVPQLACVTWVEEAIIAFVTQYIAMFRLPSGATQFRGHVCFLPQATGEWVSTLPRLPSEVPIMIVRRGDNKHGHVDLVVNIPRNLAALEWLVGVDVNGRPNNELYSQGVWYNGAFHKVVIDLSRLRYYNTQEDGSTAFRSVDNEEHVGSDDGPTGTGTEGTIFGDAEACRGRFQHRAASQGRMCAAPKRASHVPLSAWRRRTTRTTRVGTRKRQR